MVLPDPVMRSKCIIDREDGNPLIASVNMSCKQSVVLDEVVCSEGSVNRDGMVEMDGGLIVSMSRFINVKDGSGEVIQEDSGGEVEQELCSEESVAEEADVSIKMPNYSISGVSRVSG